MMDGLKERCLHACLGVWLVSGAGAGFAASDSDADASASFKAVRASTAVVIRVPINAQGQEYIPGASMRLYQGASVNTSSDLRMVFENSHDVSSDPHVTSSDIKRDSSTCGWYGGGGYGGYGGYGGWADGNYFGGYQPSYYYGGNYYNYGSPYYQDYYGGYGGGSYGGYGNRYYGYSPKFY